MYRLGKLAKDNETLKVDVTRVRKLGGWTRKGHGLIPQDIIGGLISCNNKDFHVTGETSVDQELNEYIRFYNEERPAYSLNYLTPKQYRESYAPGIAY